MSESTKAFHFSIPAKSAAEQLIRTAQRLTEISEFANRHGSVGHGDTGQVIQHLFGLAEIELRLAGQSMERLRKQVQELALGHVLEQCS